MTTWAQKITALADLVVAEANVPCVIAGQNMPTPAVPYARLKVIMKKSLTSDDEARDQPADLTRVKDVTITPIVANATTYTATIEGVDYSYTSGGSATATQITAGLAAALALAPVTVVDLVGTLRVYASAVFHMSLSSDLGMINNDAGHEFYSLIGGQREFVASFQFISASAIPGQDAQNYADLLYDALGTGRVLDTLDAVDVAVVQRFPVLAIDDIAGSINRTRAIFDIRFRTTRAADVQDSGFISDVVVTSDLL